MEQRNTGVTGYANRWDISDILKEKDRAIQKQDLDTLTNLYGAGTVGSEAMLGLGNSGQGGWQTQRLGQQQITANRKRVQDLVKLDPTNPLALLVTLLGAEEERELRGGLDSLRGRDRNKEKQIAKVKAFEKSLKLSKNEDEFAAVVERHFGGDVVAAMNAPNIRGLISEEKNRPVELNLKDYHKILENMNGVIQKLENIRRGTDFSNPRQIAFMENFIQMSERVLSGQLGLSRSDNKTLQKMGGNFNFGYDPEGNPIGITNIPRGNGRFRKSLSNPKMLTKLVEHNPKLKPLVDKLNNGTATNEDVIILEHGMNNFLDQAIKHHDEPPTLTGKVSDWFGEKIEDANEFLADSPVSDIKSVASNVIARYQGNSGDNFAYEGIGDKRQYKNMYNGVEHEALVNVNNGTYVINMGGGKIGVGYIHDYDNSGQGITKVQNEKGEWTTVRNFDEPIKVFDIGDNWRETLKEPVAWWDAINFSNELPSHETVSTEDIEAVVNSSSSPTEGEEDNNVYLKEITIKGEKPKVLPDNFAEPPFYDALQDEDIIGVEQHEKNKLKASKYNVKNAYNVSSEHKTMLNNNLNKLQEKYADNPEKLKSINQLIHAINGDDANSDDPYGVYGLLDSIEQSDVYQDYTQTQPEQPGKIVPLRKRITRSTYAFADTIQDALKTFSVEDFDQLLEGYEDYAKKSGRDTYGIPVLGAVGHVYYELQNLFTTKGLSSKARIVGGWANKAKHFLLGDENTNGDKTKAKNIPNVVPENAFVKPIEGYGDYMTDLVSVETGWVNKIGYKLKVKKENGVAVLRNGKKVLVYDKNSSGKKIPLSYGVGQLTIDTAFRTPFGRELLRSVDIGKTKEERMKNKAKLLMVPAFNLRMAKQYENLLRKKFMDNQYAKDFDPIDMNLLVATAYNYKGESLVKILNQKKPKSFLHLTKLWRFPEETKRHIANMTRKMLERGKQYGN